MTGKRKYEDDVVPFLSKATIIELSPTDIELVRQFALQFQKAKSTEYIHQIDDEQEIKRYMTGFSAELALEKLLGENESIYIPLGATHCLENPGKIPLDLIEVRSGSYLEEDDIVRFTDIYE